MKQFVVKIGYEYYQIEMGQIGNLLALAPNLTRLLYKDYRTYRKHPEPEPIFEAIEYVEVEENQREEEPVEYNEFDLNI